MDGLADETSGPEATMALAKCRECGGQVSTEALSCPHCGAPSPTSSPSLAPAGPGRSGPAPLLYDPVTDTFGGTPSQLVNLAMRAVQELGWTLENANETLGLITFETGMSWGSWSGISCSLNIEELGESRFRVTGTGKQNLKGGQIIAANFFGEAEARVAKAIGKMKELAPQEPVPGALPSATVCGTCGAEVSSDHRFCVVCGGPLTAAAASA